MGTTYKMTYLKSSRRWRKRHRGNEQYFPLRPNENKDTSYGRCWSDCTKWMATIDLAQDNEPEDDVVTLPDFAEEQIAAEQQMHAAAYSSRNGHKCDPQQTIAAKVNAWLDNQAQRRKAGSISVGRYDNLLGQVTYYRDFAGADADARQIDGSSLNDYLTHLRRKIADGDFAPSYAADHWAVSKQFVRWLYVVGTLRELPRIFEDRTATIDVPEKDDEWKSGMDNDELTLLLGNVPDSQRLYNLLMLNTGFTQKDIADLVNSEVDWSEGRITRARSKTRKKMSGKGKGGKRKTPPKVSYKLWPETFALLKAAANPDKSPNARVLLNENGMPLQRDEITEAGKRNKVCNITSGFFKIRQKLKRKHDVDVKSLSHLRKTSASRLFNHKDYRPLHDLFLGHSSGTVALKHYIGVQASVLDEAIDWLREQYLDAIKQ